MSVRVSLDRFPNKHTTLQTDPDEAKANAMPRRSWNPTCSLSPTLTEIHRPATDRFGTAAQLPRSIFNSPDIPSRGRARSTRNPIINTTATDNYLLCVCMAHHPNWRNHISHMNYDASLSGSESLGRFRGTRRLLPSDADPNIRPRILREAFTHIAKASGLNLLRDPVDSYA